MKSFKSALAACVVACAAAAAMPAAATTYTEDFEGAFPAWESGWFGANSNAENYYGDGQGRGNNPDGLWIAQDGCNGSCAFQAITVTFNAAFAATLTSFAFDVAGYQPSTLTIFDKDGTTLLSTALTLTFGATTDPGVYANYAVNSTNGIGGFSFSGGAGGNTSIDNIVATTDGNVGGVPEPGTWALMILGFGAAGAALRRRQGALAV